ncbi:MAG: TlpA disulfide reductase family protein [Haloferacaceae archaeon]
MRRRDLIAGVGSLGVIGTGALVASGGMDGVLRGEAVPETTLETIDARGSDAGETVVPERGSVSFVDFFATWCSDCLQYLGTLAEFHERTPDEVQFVSVTTEQVGTAITREEIGRWFDGERTGSTGVLGSSPSHRGNWTVAIDPSMTLAEPLGATQVPYSFVIDESNRVAWSDPGIHEVGELESALSEAY